VDNGTNSFENGRQSPALGWRVPLAAVLWSMVSVFALNPAIAHAQTEAAPTDRRDASPTAKLPPMSAAAALAAADRFAQAIAAFDKGDLSSAQRLFEEVIALDPSGEKASQARHHLGQLYSTLNVPSAVPPAAPMQKSQTEPSTEQPPPVNRTRVTGRYRSAEEEFIGEVGDRVFFSPGSADLGTRAVAVVEAQADWLKQKPTLNASIAGYADEPNLSPEQNESLSEARAIAVRDRLISEGIANERVSVVAWGRDGRLATCDEVQCQVQNRRAVTVLVPKNGNAPVRPRPPANAPVAMKRALQTQ
jgi:outer membrane protein OmpA-like peptidoglycan-associated protein